MIINEIDINIFQKAIDIYLKTAYPHGIKKGNFCYNDILILKEAKTLQDIYTLFKEDKIVIRDNKTIKKYTMRLGSEKYPFMKLVLQEVNNLKDYGFYVDRHVEYLGGNEFSQSYKSEIKIKEYTKKCKNKIEKLFEKNGIPSYRKIIKELTDDLNDNKKKLSKNLKKNEIKVLYVEDEKELLHLNKINLELRGYIVSTAENGEQAINKVKHEKNNIMILDLMIPKMSGFEVIKNISHKIPIIVVSALADKNSKETCKAYGAKDFLIKPVDIEILNDCIQRILKK